MNTSAIREYIHRDPVLRRHRIYVTTSDKPIVGEACVVNTLRSGDNGIGHWYVVANINGRRELFDSLTMVSSSVAYDITNKRPVQHPTSTACGHHCCLYLSMRFRGISLSQVVKQYSSDLNANDRLAYYFVSMVNRR